MATPHDDSMLAHILRINRPLLRVSEVAEILTLGVSTVYELIEAGRIESHDLTGEVKPASQLDLFGNSAATIAARRAAVRVTRRSVVAFLLRTASYELDAPAVVQVIARLLGDLPITALEAIASRATQVAAARRLQSPG